MVLAKANWWNLGSPHNPPPHQEEVKLLGCPLLLDPGGLAFSPPPLQPVPQISAQELGWEGCLSLGLPAVGPRACVPSVPPLLLFFRANDSGLGRHLDHCQTPSAHSPPQGIAKRQ